MGKQKVDTSNAVLLSIKKKNWGLKPQKDIDETQMHIIKWNKPEQKDYIWFHWNANLKSPGRTLETVNTSVLVRPSGGVKHDWRGKWGGF